MADILIGNGFLILFVALLAMFFSEPPRFLVFAGTLWGMIALSTFVWVVYVVVHYAAKYW